MYANFQLRLINDPKINGVVIETTNATGNTEATEFDHAINEIQRGIASYAEERNLTNLRIELVSFFWHSVDGHAYACRKACQEAIDPLLTQA